MRQNIAPDAAGLTAFLDGYILHFLQTRLAAGDPAETGLYAYYAARVTQRLGGLLDYEVEVAEFVLRSFAPDRPVVHVGIGIGTTTALLAARGRKVAGVEADARRTANARLLRDDLAAVLPNVAGNYVLAEGRFPEILQGLGEQGFVGRDSVVLFTNFGATLPHAVEEGIIQACVAFGDLVLDLRLFGRSREDAAEREALLSRIVAAGMDDAGGLPSPATPNYRHLTWSRRES